MLEMIQQTSHGVWDSAGWQMPIDAHFFRWAILTHKAGQTDLVFGVGWGLTSSSLCAKFQVSVCSSYDFPNVVAQRHIFWGAHRGGYDTKFEFGRDFCTMHLPLNFIIYVYVYLLRNYRVDKQTNKNKQTPLKMSNTLRCTTTLGNTRSSATAEEPHDMLHQLKYEYYGRFLTELLTRSSA